MSKYDKLKLPELQELAEGRGIATTKLKRKRHFIDALETTDVNAASEEQSTKTQSTKRSQKQQCPEKTPTQMSDYGLEASIDYGTWKLVFTYVFTYKGERMESPIPLLFAGNSAEVRMLAAFIGDEFVHGPELERRANLNSSISDKVISSFKLGLYPDAETSPITKSIVEILRECGKTLDDLLFEHMRAVWQDIKVALKATTFQIQFSDAEIEELFNRAHVRVTVPQMWGPHARRRMQAAAKKAGMKVVVLSSEPHCALAFLIHEEAQKKVVPNRQLRKLDSILVADIGCGTADFAMLELEDDLGASSKFKSIGQSTGDLCGSGMVDEHLFTALTKRKGRAWYVKSFQHLGVTERDFRRRALIALENIKTNFDPARETGVELIHGIGVAHVVIDITKAEFESAMHTVIIEIKKRIDVFIMSRTPTVIENLKKCYKGIIVISPNEGMVGQCFPVAMGALLRYDSILPQKLPAQYGYAMLMTEPFDEKIHLDAYTMDHNFVMEEDFVSLKPCVLAGFYDADEEIVEHRIRNIVQKGDIIAAGQKICQKFSFDYRVPWENPRISASFVITDKSFPEHAAAKDYDPNMQSYKLRLGVHDWASIEFPIPDSKLRNKGFKTIVAHNEYFWLVQAQVVVQCRDQDFQIGFKVSNGKDVDFEVRDMVWQAGHSEFLE